MCGSRWRRQPATCDISMIINVLQTIRFPSNRAHSKKNVCIGTSERRGEDDNDVMLQHKVTNKKINMCFVVLLQHETILWGPAEDSLIDYVIIWILRRYVGHFFIDLCD
jgi:hypothetical protein